MIGPTKLSEVLRQLNSATSQSQIKMTGKQLAQLLDRVAKLEAEVEQLKSVAQCGGGWEGIFGSQKDNPLFEEVIAHIQAERAADKSAVESALAKKPKPKKRVSRSSTTAKR